MSKEIDNFVDEFIAELENDRIEREENIKNFVNVFNEKVPVNYKFELETFDNYIWKSKLPNKTLEVGFSNVGPDCQDEELEICDCGRLATHDAHTYCDDCY